MTGLNPEIIIKAKIIYKFSTARVYSPNNHCKKIWFGYLMASACPWLVYRI